MDWIFEELEKNAAEDIYSARSWLLVTKCIFPQNFRVLFEAYKLEKMEKNLNQCALLLSEMFRDFPDEYLLNKELEQMVMKQSPDKDDQQLLTSIFDAFSPDLQQSILIYVAQKQTDIDLLCKLTITATQKLPKDTMKYGLPLIEKLVNDEKEEFSSTPLNKYRKILICDVLPVICDSPVRELSHKQFYKWLQKAIEFFVAFNTTSHKIVAESIGKVDVQWSHLESIRSKIGKQCDWEPFPHGTHTLTDRMKFIKEMHRLSRTDVTGNINKKQIFYSSILLLLESSIELTKLLDPGFFNPGYGPNGSSAYMICLQPCVFTDRQTGTNSLSTLKETAFDCFQVARTSWQILHSNESYSKDFSHLVKRWKMDRWVWLQLFLSLHHILEKDYKGCIIRLTRLLEQNWNDQYHLVSLRCLGLLASVYYVTEQKALACKCIIDCVTKMGIDPNQHSPKKTKIENVAFCDGPDNSTLMLMQVNFPHFLPFWIHVIITSLSINIRSTACTDDALGHLIVLSQQDWPKWKELCGSVLNVISSKSKFTYPIFFDYVVVADILEEISLLRNSSNNKSITLFHSNFANQQRVTRGVNKGNEEEFNNAIATQMNKGEENLEEILADFFLKQEKSILDSVCIAEEAMEQ